MNQRSGSIQEKDAEQPPNDKDYSSELLTLLNFYWLKFLSRKRTIEQEKKIWTDELTAIETEEKIHSTRLSIDDLTSS